MKCHTLGEYYMKAARFGVKTPQTKYLGGLLAVFLMSLIPAPLSRSGRAVLVQRSHKYSSIFCARSVIDLLFVCCHLPFSSRLSLRSVCRKRGAILNISSASCMYPVPLLTVYSASKVIAIQRIWPFPHLLNWNVIISHICPACVTHAAVETRSVPCLFSLGTLSSLPYLLTSCQSSQNVDMYPVHQLPIPALPAWFLVCFAGAMLCRCCCILRVVRWLSGLLALRWQKFLHCPPPLSSLPLGRICDCPFGKLGP